MRESHIVASCAHLELCSRAKCPPHFHFRVVARWTTSVVFAKALIMAFEILSNREMPRIFAPFSFDKPGSSSSGFLSVSRFGSCKVVLGRYRIPVLQIVVSNLDSYLVG